MQIFKAGVGDVVRVRQCTWRVRDVRTYEGCALLTLAGVGASTGLERQILSPFDTVEPLPHARHIPIVTPQRWRHACRALLGADVPVGGLRSAARAGIDLLPHQLEPALAIASGLGVRMLIADDVGLGKTIQAALVLAELRARLSVERALILTPAGLREQWVDELATRFGIAATLVDSRELRRRRADLAIGVNPWSTMATAIASIDFVKRPDVLPSVSTCRWDIVIVDEAHNVSGDTDRHAACATLCSRAPYVVLLTATPHSGDRNSFLSLCRLGAHGDSLLLFRRTRKDVGIGHGRRVRLLRVRPSAAERRMHALVARLTALAIRDLGTTNNEEDDDATWLALAVINKRALSSAGSLQATVERRLATTESRAVQEPWQPGLPLFDRDGDADDADAPPDVGFTFRNAREGGALLEEIAAAARTATRTGETKIAAVVRLLRRVHEPAIVFTEFRDTLERIAQHLNEPAAVLHGGLSRDERHAALEEFTSGRRRLLLATDAAGEGLNLHDTCRLVVNLELPWNPMRLEQRIGRVDRIGQRRVVHAIHLVARDTTEVDVLARLRVRVARAKDDIGAADPLPAIDERAFARMVIGGQDRPIAPQDPPSLGFVEMSLETEAEAERDRLAMARQLLRRSPPIDLVLPRPGEVWLTFARKRATRIALGGRALLLLAASCEDGDGRLLESRIVPVLVDWHSSRRPRVAAREWIPVAEPMAVNAVDSVLSRWREEALQAAQRGFDLRIRREQMIAATYEISPRPIQQGLFDRRIERTDEGARALISEAVAECAGRIRRLQHASSVSIAPPQLVLVLA